ncbi:MAG: biotin--[acetyl-CoA-carboxylase] ligase [Ignavibacteriaceae bacterium]|nr:biotin--[acetyl-CoA-carboxylase] ligase [Ignavibacteriaceae bacterium]
MFNLEDFDIKLDTDYIGRRFVYGAEVDSTNAVLMNPEYEFNENGTVLLAEKQLKGRGRLGRIWYSSKDFNLTFSILLNDKSLFSKNLTLLVFGAANVVAASIENLFQLRSEVKWPNDILINGKKVAGILLESASHGKKINRLVVGIGINVNQQTFHGDFPIEATSIKNELNQNVERESLLAEVLNIFEEMLNKYKADPAQILKDWRMRCRMIGERIDINDGVKSRYGIFDDVDENGALLLRTEKGIEKIIFGDVSRR